MDREEIQRRLDIFADVTRRYRSCRILLDYKIGAINPAASAKQETRRESGIEKNIRFCADYLICGRNTLEVSYPRRYQFFILCFCGDLSYADAARRMQVSVNTLKDWAREIRLDVAPEMERLGLWPPQDYFEKSLAVQAEMPAEVRP